MNALLAKHTYTTLDADIQQRVVGQTKYILLRDGFSEMDI